MRDPDEERTSSQLELFFDLTFVAGVSRASAALHGELAAGHVGNGVVGFVGAFFAIWWAWMNFTWFASAHDSDDVPYRLLTIVQMAGVLVLAAGLDRAVVHHNFAIATIGYAIMRSGLVISWLRVARDHPASRVRALRYAGGMSALQVLWLLRLATPYSWTIPTFVGLGILELLTPMWAEEVAQPLFNASHIEERYGLFTIILLGEAILSASTGFQVALTAGGFTARLLVIGIAALFIAFAAWWLYFDHPGHLRPTRAQAFRWGYSHLFIFIALAALGAGVQVATGSELDHTHVRIAAMAVGVPCAAYLLGLAIVMMLTGTAPTDQRVLPKLGGAGAIVIVGMLAPVMATAVICAVIMVGLATAMVLAGPRIRVRVEAPT